MSRAAGACTGQPAVSLQLWAGRQHRPDAVHRTPQGLTLTRDGAALLPQAESASGAGRFTGSAGLTAQCAARCIGTILDPAFCWLGAP
jgi:DNA-binding transcriptional LysR family regulator